MAVLCLNSGRGPENLLYCRSLRGKADTKNKNALTHVLPGTELGGSVGILHPGRFLNRIGCVRVETTAAIEINQTLAQE